MKVKQEFFGFNPVMWMGVVEDNEDPVKLGRVKVRIFGWHAGNQNPRNVGYGENGNYLEEIAVRTEDLPWAQVMQPVNASPNSGTGGPLTGIQNGTWVMGIFLDGEIAREPMVMGSIPGIPSRANPNDGGNPTEGFYDPKGIYPRTGGKSWDLDEPDTNRLARNDEDYVHNIIDRKLKNKFSAAFVDGNTLEEPLLNEWNEFKSKYPHNKVWETAGGHIFEVDDTPKFKRIHIFCQDGSYIEWGGAVGRGSRMDRIKGNWYTMIDGNHYNAVGGDIYTTGRHVTIAGKSIVLQGGSITLDSPVIVSTGATKSGSVKSMTGVSGTFTAVGGRLVTVMNGIVTNIGKAS